MDDYGPGTYGDRVAGIYDDWYAELPFGGELATTVSFLRELAADGSALELGIGTGRVALPLRQAGVDIHGIDASDAMVERLRAKPGGADIPVTMGDFRDFSLEKRFRLVYVVFNTFFGLLTQDDQVACRPPARTASAHCHPVRSTWHHPLRSRRSGRGSCA